MSVDPGLLIYSQRAVGQGHFNTVPGSIRVLVLNALLMDEFAEMVNEMINDGVGKVTLLALALFVFIGNFTLLNMIIGFMCELAADLAEDERQRGHLEFLKTRVGSILESYDLDNGGSLSREEFDLLLSDPEFHDCMLEYGTEAEAMVALTDTLFQDAEERILNKPRQSMMQSDRDSSLSLDSDGVQIASIAFPEILHVVMQLRGSNHSKITDI